MKSILEGISPLDIIASFIEPNNNNSSRPKKSGKERALTFLQGPDVKNNRNLYLGGSISNYASDLIMTFPMLIDNSLSPELCSMLSKASERNIVTMLHLLFSSMQMNGTNGRDVIKSIYGKMKVNMSMDDYIDKVNDFVSTYENYHIGYVDRDKETKRLINETVRAITECVKEGKIFLPAFSEENISETALTDYMVIKDHRGETVVKEATPPKDHITVTPDGTNADFLQPDFGYRTMQGVNLADPGDVRNYNDVVYKKWQIDQARQKREDDLADAKLKYNDSRNQAGYQQQTDIIGRRILDSDVKKANELQPTLMVVNFNELNTDDTIYNKKAFVCGVKSRLVPVDSNDIIERIVAKNKTRLSFLNFIRATTKEIGFFKDFIFCLDQAKADARNSIKKGEAAQVWKALEVMSNKNKLNKMRRNGNDASAITTLVINKETANFMKKQFKIDIENPKFATMIMDTYNLLALFIVDESVEIVRNLYRGNDMFDQQAFSYLEREENDKSYKKVINLIGQMNR